MCFSAGASYTAAAILIPAGGLAVLRARKGDRRYIALAALPLLFGFQQLFEGLAWGAEHDEDLDLYSLGYMFFTWLVWPIWAPLAVYRVETGRRRSVYVSFAIVGAMLGAVQYLPYFVHDGWLTVRFLPAAISYEGIYLLDYLIPRPATYTIYLAVVILPFLISRDRGVAFFGLLVALVATVTYAFFSYAYVSVFCFGAALMSLWLVYLVYQRPTPGSVDIVDEAKAGPRSDATVAG